MTVFRPSLAANASWEEINQILTRGDVMYASTKLDGIRACVLNGKLVSRTLKPIRNRYIQSLLGSPELEGLDGELIVGAPYGEGVFARTSSDVMSEAGQPNFTYYVIDNHGLGRAGIPFIDRYEALKITQKTWNIPEIKLLHQNPFWETAGLEEYEQGVVAEGYEGVILRWSHSPYKLGRSTVRERYMLKLKRFQDSEAAVIGFQERMKNENEPTRDARGLTVRSVHQANQRPSDTLGALRIQDLKKPEWVFNIGSGFDDATRQKIWNNQGFYLGKIVKYKYLPIGTVDLPRHPIFLGFRDQEDL